MHVSLDSALGRQRRLNSVGESVLQIAPNAAAAYSLRSLTGGSPKVVRVRRASDNGERDFTSAEINSGEMVSWVNQQTIAPLDIQALEADGRTGDFLIAKAAYSLRSLGTRQATLAATGDTVARADGKFVVQVRRSSDDALKSFTAAEITDGTLLAFVNDILTVTTAVNGTGSFDSYTVTNASTTGFSADNSAGGTGSAGFPYSFGNGDVIVIKYTVTNFSDTSDLSPQVRGVTATSSVVPVTSVGSVIRANGTYTDTLTASADGTHLMYADGGTGSYTISDFEIVSHASNGFVKTWYDQSVTNEAGDTATGNHATQATAASQPKIVINGALNADGIKFDGTDDFLDIGGTGTNPLGIQSTDPLSIYTVQIASNNVILGDDSNRLLRFRPSGVQYYLSTNPIDESWASSASSTELSLFSSNFGGTGATSLVKTNVNGVAGSTTDSDQGTSGANTAASPIEFIGGKGAGSLSLLFEKSVKEIIIYVSDQTDNRTALEANIGEAYSITGIPAYDNEVDGFVETWYDQSGNGKDATQATAGSQPKIVDEGALVTESSLPAIDFDGTDDFFTASGFAFSPAGDFLSLIVSKVSTGQLFDTRDGASDGLFIQQGNSNIRNIYNGDGDIDVSGNNEHTLSTLELNGTTLTAYKNGTSGGTDTVTAGLSTTRAITISKTSFNSSNFINGNIQEIILYDTDQNANRTALETNINSQYSIF